MYWDIFYISDWILAISVSITIQISKRNTYFTTLKNIWFSFKCILYSYILWVRSWFIIINLNLSRIKLSLWKSCELPRSHKIVFLQKVCYRLEKKVHLIINNKCIPRNVKITRLKERIILNYKTIGWDSWKSQNFNLFFLPLSVSFYWSFCER